MRLPTPTTVAPPSALVAAAITAGRLAAAPAQAAALPSLDALYSALPAAAAAAASHRAAVVEWRAAAAAATAASAARRRWRWRGRASSGGETLLGRAADALVATGVVGSGAPRPPPHAPVPPLPPRGLALVGGVGAGKTLLMDAFVAAAAGLAPGVRVRRLHTAELLTGVYARLRWWDASSDGDRAAAGVGSPTEAAAAVALWGREEGRDGGGGCAAGEERLLGGGWGYGCSPANAVGRVVPGWPEGLADGWTGGSSGGGIGTLDDLPPAAVRVLCVDEVAVPDVGTRVILGGVLRSLVGGGVVLVFTANRGVAEMDRSGSGGGFLEDLMHRDMVVVHLATEEAVAAQWAAQTGTAWTDTAPMILPSPISGRPPLRIPHAVTLPPLPPPPAQAAGAAATPCRYSDEHRVGNWKRGHSGSDALEVILPPPLPVRAARFTFEELCGAALAPADYAALASYLDMLFLTGVPRLSTDAGLRDGARRLITAVDALAEAQVLLVVSAEAPLEDLWGPPPPAVVGSAAVATATSITAATAAASTTTTATTEAALDLAEAAEFETEATRRGVGAANRGGGLYSGEDVAYAWARAASRLRAAAAFSGRLAGVADVHAAVAATRTGGGWTRHLSPVGVWGGGPRGPEGDPASLSSLSSPSSS